MMELALFVLLPLVGFIVAYFVYGRYISRRLLGLDPKRRTPSLELQDGVDYVPANRFVLLGHHFASIAGLGPIIGPAIAIVWGWLPALLWVVFGSILMGAVHDLTALGMSLRHKGRSIGDITRDILGPRAMLLFQLVVFFLLSMAMGVFAQAVGKLFTMLQPRAVIPAFGLIAVAMAAGVLMYRFKVGLLTVTTAGLVLMALLLFLGFQYPVTMAGATTLVQVDNWVYILILYAFTASVLPVWLLLQPRDYLNSFQLYIGFILMVGGVLILAVKGGATIDAPAVREGVGVFGSTEGTDIPAILPFLFITVACGAISGFHSLVSTGTTVRQLRSEKEANFVAYGSMLLEGFLAVLVLLACAIAFDGVEESWSEHYSRWEGIDRTALGRFVGGSGFLISQFGIDHGFATTLSTVIIVGFAMTTLDSGTRVLRYNIEEIAKAVKLPLLSNRYLASVLAIGSIAFFALMKKEILVDGVVHVGSAGELLWQLFGTTNQLLAGLGLLAVTVWLRRSGKPIVFTFLPMVFMMGMTLYAMILKINDFLKVPNLNWSLVFVAAILLAMGCWLLVEGVIALRRPSHAPMVPHRD